MSRTCRHISEAAHSKKRPHRFDSGRRLSRTHCWRGASRFPAPTALTPAAIRENILRTSTPPDPSDASGNPRKVDDLDAPGHICTPGFRLRALWGDFPVVVRVHSGALEKKRSACSPGSSRGEAAIGTSKTHACRQRQSVMRRDGSRRGSRARSMRPPALAGARRDATWARCGARLIAAIANAIAYATPHGLLGTCGWVQQLRKAAGWRGTTRAHTAAPTDAGTTRCQFWRQWPCGWSPRGLHQRRRSSLRCPPRRLAALRPL